MNLEKQRCVGIHVGHFSEAEALEFVTERMPTSFADRLCREAIARRIVQEFDTHVLTLRNLCLSLREGKPGDIDDLSQRIRQAKQDAEQKAVRGWLGFLQQLSKILGSSYDPAAVDAVVQELLKGPVTATDMAMTLSRKSDRVPLSSRLIGLCNADAGYHPLEINPFNDMASLSGKTMTAVLQIQKKAK
ncbi:MAG: hypothetical protein SGARI_007885 [Bacillariaceae sp.]